MLHQVRTLFESIVFKTLTCDPLTKPLRAAAARRCCRAASWAVAPLLPPPHRWCPWWRLHGGRSSSCTGGAWKLFSCPAAGPAVPAVLPPPRTRLTSDRMRRILALDCRRIHLLKAQHPMPLPPPPPPPSSRPCRPPLPRPTARRARGAGGPTTGSGRRRKSYRAIWGCRSQGNGGSRGRAVQLTAYCCC